MNRTFATLAAVAIPVVILALRRRHAIHPTPAVERHGPHVVRCLRCLASFIDDDATTAADFYFTHECRPRDLVRINAERALALRVADELAKDETE